VREDGLVASARGPRADRPKRRTFTPAYKLAIVGQYGQLADARERGALLRREGLYHSHVQQWREAIDKGTLPALSAKPAGRPARSVAEVDNERLPEGERETRRVLMPEHQHFGHCRPVTAEQHDDQAECPAGQHLDDLEQHPPSQPSPCPACRQQCGSTSESSVRAAQGHREHLTPPVPGDQPG